MEKLNIASGTEQLWFEPNFDTRSIDVFHYHPYHETRTKLISWRGNDRMPGGVWEGDNHINKNQFFRILKQHPKGVVRKLNACKDKLWNGDVPEQSWDKTWQCFKRRVNIKIHKLIK